MVFLLPCEHSDAEEAAGRVVKRSDLTEGRAPAAQHSSSRIAP